MIIDIQKSNRKYKRFVVRMDDGRLFHFGLKMGQTYIDHGDESLRKRYWNRHYNNEKEKYLIDNLIPSPALFSSMVLWGRYPDIERNIENLNGLWRQKHKKN